MKQLNTAALFLILLAAARWIPSGNEDHYMALAKAWFDPGWIPGSWILDEPAGARGLYNLLVGWLLSRFDFYTVSIVLKILLSWWYARILSGYISPAVLGVVCYCPTFFGGEFIFMGCEPKHFAWALVLWHLTRRGRHTPAVLALATWFHVLVGGWYAVYWFLTHPGQWRKGVAYAILVAPLCYYLAGTQAGGEVAGCDAGFIYTRVRNLHHCYPLLYSKRDFLGFLVCLLCIPFSRKGLSRNMMTGCCVLAAVTSFFPADQVVKLIPYRMLSLALLLELQQHYLGRVWLRWPVRIAGLLCALYLLGTNIKDTWLYVTDHDYAAEIARVRQLPPDAIIVSERSDFIRRSGRDVFVNTKFIPNAARRICEWQRRREWVEKNSREIVFAP